DEEEESEKYQREDKKNRNAEITFGEGGRKVFETSIQEEDNPLNTSEEKALRSKVIQPIIFSRILPFQNNSVNERLNKFLPNEDNSLEKLFTKYDAWRSQSVKSFKEETKNEKISSFNLNQIGFEDKYKKYLKQSIKTIHSVSKSEKIPVTNNYQSKEILSKISEDYEKMNIKSFKENNPNKKIVISDLNGDILSNLEKGYLKAKIKEFKENHKNEKIKMTSTFYSSDNAEKCYEKYKEVTTKTFSSEYKKSLPCERSQFPSCLINQPNEKESIFNKLENDYDKQYMKTFKEATTNQRIVMPKKYISLEKIVRNRELEKSAGGRAYILWESVANDFNLKEGEDNSKKEEEKNTFKNESFVLNNIKNKAYYSKVKNNEHERIFKLSEEGYLDYSSIYASTKYSFHPLDKTVYPFESEEEKFFKTSSICSQISLKMSQSKILRNSQNSLIQDKDSLHSSFLPSIDNDSFKSQKEKSVNDSYLEDEKETEVKKIEFKSNGINERKNKTFFYYVKVLSIIFLISYLTYNFFIRKKENEIEVYNY
ncbi:MAG: hypothetical protein MJ252_03495, partial [archaeon]|nr:hypothetical protein [archaeon]